MREILFRGKSLDDGKWITGYYSGPVGLDSSHEICDINDPVGSRVDVDPATVGQYAGMNDKNGTKIFEGDIVRFSLITGRSLVYQGLRNVTFNGGSFMIEDPISGDDESICRIAEIELEIVGNVHDNKQAYDAAKWLASKGVVISIPPEQSKEE